MYLRLPWIWTPVASISRLLRALHRTVSPDRRKPLGSMYMRDISVPYSVLFSDPFPECVQPSIMLGRAQLPGTRLRCFAYNMAFSLSTAIQPPIWRIAQRTLGKEISLRRNPQTLRMPRSLIPSTPLSNTNHSGTPFLTIEKIVMVKSTTAMEIFALYVARRAMCICTCRDIHPPCAVAEIIVIDRLAVSVGLCSKKSVLMWRNEFLHRWPEQLVLAYS